MKVKTTFYESGARDAFPGQYISLATRGKDAWYCFEAKDIGWVALAKTRWGFWETHARLEKAYRGRGYGLYLYGYAFDKMLKLGHEIKSSTTPSYKATRLWESKRLNDRYRIEFIGRRYHVHGHKTIPRLKDFIK